MNRPTAIYTVICDTCGAEARGLAKDLADEGWKRMTATLKTGEKVKLMRCREHAEGYQVEASKLIAKSLSFSTQIGGITLSGGVFGGKASKRASMDGTEADRAKLGGHERSVSR